MSEFNPLDRVLNDVQDQVYRSVKRVLWQFLISLTRPIATVTEVFFRAEMGERYFTAWNVVAGAALIFLAGTGSMFYFIMVRQTELYLSTSNQIHITSGQVVAMIFMALWLVFFGLASLAQFESVSYRYERGIRWHSYCPGIPRFPFLPVQLEHLIPMGGGVLMMVCGMHLVGLLLIISSCVSAQMRAAEATAFRERLLDTVDGEIEMKNLSAAIMERYSPAQAEGLSAPVPASASKQFRRRLAEVLSATARARAAGTSGPTPSPAPKPSTATSAATGVPAPEATNGQTAAASSPAQHFQSVASAPADNFGSMSSGRGGACTVTIDTTTGFFAIRASDGKFAVYHAGKQDLPEAQQLIFWSCASAEDATPAGNVVGIDCSNNKLVSLDVTRLTALQTLSCHDNDLPELNLVGLKELLHLNCANNRLAILTASGCSHLMTIDCTGNPGVRADLEGIAKLQVLKRDGVGPVAGMS